MEKRDAFDEAARNLRYSQDTTHDDTDPSWLTAMWVWWARLLYWGDTVRSALAGALLATLLYMIYVWLPLLLAWPVSVGLVTWWMRETGRVAGRIKRD